MPAFRVPEARLPYGRDSLHVPHVRQTASEQEAMEDDLSDREIFPNRLPINRSLGMLMHTLIWGQARAPSLASLSAFSMANFRARLGRVQDWIRSVNQKRGNWAGEIHLRHRSES